MNTNLYLCIHAAEFPAQALLRLRPDLNMHPVAVLDGRPPNEMVCSLNQLARHRGLSLGMTRLDAENMDGLILLRRSPESESSARSVMLECAASFSPRIEEVSQGTFCSFVLDITGTERLFGSPQTLAMRLRTSLADAGFRVSLVVSANLDTARLKAATMRGITSIPAGEEAAALAGLPVAALDLGDEPLETFALWGIRTLGELAALPETELVTRLGPPAYDWRQLALGVAAHMFQPIEPAFSLREFCEFDAPVDQIESLLFVAARMIDCLTARAAYRALSLASIDVYMKLDRGREHRNTIKPALPTIDRKFLLKLLQLEIAAHPPSAGVVAVTLTAEAGQSSKVQLGLFTPQLPEPSRLDVTLARLKAIVGEERVGSPVLEDSHRRGIFRMEGFAVRTKASASLTAPTRVALRRLRPPVPVRVVLDAMKPAAFRDRESRFEITAAYGPWRTAGCWWSIDAWDAEEWDVLASKNNATPIACLLVHNLARREWRLEALYD
jgi:protein ImuB